MVRIDNPETGMQEASSRWNESYNRGENNILEPYEELVKFLNRFVVQRSAETGQVTAKDNFGTIEVGEICAVDIGCGIGAQSEYLSRLGFSCHGFDLSEIAISAATKRTTGMKCAPTFTACNVDTISLPKEINLAIACASLDSMPFDDACSYIRHVRDAAAPAALFFGTFIGRATEQSLDEEIVTEAHEFGTVQSYFDPPKIERLLSHGNVDILRIDRISNVNVLPGLAGRAPDRYSVVGRFPN